MRIWIVLLLAATAFTINSCQGHAEEPQKTSATAVTLAKVQKQAVVHPIIASGILSAPQEVALSFKTGGIVATILTDEGAAVKKGDLLAKLDIREISAYAQQAAIAKDKADRDAARVKKLYADSAASLEQVQNAQSGLDAARAQYAIARFNLEKAQINAPFDGRVLKRLMDPGEMSGPGAPVLIIGSRPERPLVKAALSDRDILRCGLGDPAQIRFDAYPDMVFKGHVKRLAGTALPGSGVFEIEIALDKTDKTLLPGFVASIELFPRQTVQLPVIPAASLTGASGKKAYVFVYNARSGTVKKQEVHIAQILNNEVAVFDSVMDGQKIVSRGAAYLSDGQHVQTVAAQ